MTIPRTMDPLWERTAESIALQHNTELKCAIQLVVEPHEIVDAPEVRQRLDVRTDGSTEAELPGSRQIERSLEQCMVANRTFRAAGGYPARFRKLSRPDQDALAGHNLTLSASAVVTFGLRELLGRTNIAEGQRRSPYFALGILREQARTPDRLSLPVLADKLQTSEATILGHVQKLSSLGVVLYSKVEKSQQVRRPETSMPPRTAIQLAPVYAYVIRRLINAAEGVSQSDPAAIEEGIEAGKRIMQKPTLLASLLGKRLGG